MQVIPHSFGRRRPPILQTTSMVEDKIRMCDVLSDIEVAQDMLDPKQEEDQKKLQPHPADEKYATLMADLKIISPEEEEYKIIDKYCQVRQTLQQTAKQMYACFSVNRFMS
jgi:poly [ADP-ribose] polymerase